MARTSRHTSKAKKNLDKASPEDYRGLSIVIPAAGVGRRMKSYGAKGLINIGTATVLERQIKLLWKAYPFSEIIIVAGFQAGLVSERIRKKYPVKIVRNYNYEESNVAHSIFLGIQASVNSQVLVVYGDLVFNYKTISKIADGQSKIVVDTRGRFGQEEVGVLFNDKIITNFSHGLKSKWAQIAYLTGKELRLFEDIASSIETEKWFGYEVVNKVIDNGGEMMPVEPSGMKVVEIDSPRDLSKAIHLASIH